MTKREEILVLVLTKLKTVTAGGMQASNVLRSKIFPTEESSLPAIDIEPVSDDENESSFGIFDHTLVLRIKVSNKVS